MRDTSSVVASCGYVLTDAGREALRQVELCKCVPKIRGGFLVCLECGTIYALLRQMAYISEGIGWRAKS